MIGTQEAGDENHSGTVAVRRSESVIDGGGMQQNQLGRKQHFAQNGEIRCLILPGQYSGAPILRSNLRFSHSPAVLLSSEDLKEERTTRSSPRLPRTLTRVNLGH